MALRKPLCSLLGLAALGLAAPAVHAQTAYVETIGDGYNFGTINLQTGLFTAISAVANPLYALGFGSDGNLYGLGPDAATGTDLFQVSTATGTQTLLQDFTTEEVFGGSGNADGTFTAITVGTDANNNRSSLFTVDPIAQTITPGALTFANADGLAVSDGSGNVYVSDQGSPVAATDSLDFVNTQVKHPSTAPLGDTGLASLYTGLFAGGQLYTFGFDPNSLTGPEGVYTLDTDTGAATFVATTSNDEAVYASALAPAAVPEASTTVSLGLLLAFGGLAAAAKRRKASRSL